MSVVLEQEPRLVHSVPGRVRIHVSTLSPSAQRDLETAIRHQPGIQSVQANPDTGNVLIRFPPQATSAKTLLETVRGFAQKTVISPRNSANGTAPEPLPTPPPAVVERRGQTRRARIAVRGLDRDPETARRVVERLERLPGVTARANTITGRVLVEWTSHQPSAERHAACGLRAGPEPARSAAVYRAVTAACQQFGSLVCRRLHSYRAGISAAAERFADIAGPGCRNSCAEFAGYCPDH